ncbi:ergosterol biosynthesis ERG4/ERG24 family-domain-containing protein [Penicillium longicatenatum]|uniref:ergosterol biosynthesis ERG4/ERG24 family-domain-containing protein n=1 Tax=Penicillium longicatenatum TaxID=1561947 RepID=UPI00254984C2|nr:ergosterol biosynthesis ERG4/ERG24 family-domain-containing protein [Penicillium longicatenatum]KAJ5644240.1 ergosterol biosynthesis ERG4/ERG24 family-domain-containing protein [Penicillium longicatenatum]
MSPTDIIATLPRVYLKGGGKRPQIDNALWGRRSHVSTISGLLSMLFMNVVQLFVIFLCICFERFDGSLQHGLLDLLACQSLKGFFQQYLPAVFLRPAIFYFGWVASQALLYSVLPGKIVYGPSTPGGHTLSYCLNGLSSWLVTIWVVLVAAYVGGAEAIASAAQSWMTIIVVANLYGLTLSALAYLKAHIWPSHNSDQRFSGSICHDFLAGIELNPRLGLHWDLKMFQVGRLGMNSWVVIDISFMARQYKSYGEVSNSMLLVIFFHVIYVVDFFLNEEWYLATIDIAHDHFGFALAWGSAVWLPVVYTSQAQYLSSHPMRLSPCAVVIILIAGVSSYALFRLSNYQKHHFRQTHGNCLIDGSKAQMIRAQYSTTDGTNHESPLLCSGFWGIVRHPNYVGDILFSFCTCVCCGWTHLLPYIYFLWMATMLVHRCYRDEKRCSAKYGPSWDAYQRRVRWRMVPGIF